MIILGIDPGLATIGYGVIERIGNKDRCIAYGVIHTDKHRSLSQRLVEISTDIVSIMKQYKPEVAVVEEIFFFKNITTAIFVSHARGVILQQLESHAIRLVERTPLQVKMAIAGHGRASKSQVQDAVKMWLGLEEIPRPDDAADGLALALSYTSFSP